MYTPVILFQIKVEMNFLFGRKIRPSDLLHFTFIIALLSGHPGYIKLYCIDVKTQLRPNLGMTFPELKDQVFSFGKTSALVLIELKGISGSFRRHSLGAPLVFSPSVTWSLWSVSGTWTIYPLSYLNLISRFISIVSPACVLKPFTQKEPNANSGRKEGLQPPQHFRPIISVFLSNANWLDKNVQQVKQLCDLGGVICCTSIFCSVQCQVTNGFVCLSFDRNHHI